jgi:hypothetical protein
VGCGEIKDVMIRPGSLAVAMVIHVSELCNPILVCIIEGSHSKGSTVGNCKGTRGHLEKYHATLSTQQDNKLYAEHQMHLSEIHFQQWLQGQTELNYKEYHCM